MGVIDTSQRIAKNLWRVPVFKQLLALDYERSFRRRPPNRFRGVYATFAEATASLPKGERIGYDHDLMAGMYRDRMDKPCESDYGPLFWLRNIIGSITKVFDFGGHVGVSYYGWRHYLPYPDSMSWTVYEVPAIVAAARELAKTRPSEHLAFTSDLADGRDCDLFLAAGSLQYVDKSLADILATVGTRPRHMLISKLPVYDGSSYVTVQSTGRAFHPYRIYSRHEFLEDVERLGYAVIDEWRNREQHCEIPFTRGRDVEAYSGFYLRRDPKDG